MKNLIIVSIAVILGLGLLWYFSMGGMHYFGGSGMQMNAQMDSSVTGDDTVECPVMGTRMNKSDAYSSTEYKGKTYYFCCPGCPGEFKKNPEKYIK